MGLRRGDVVLVAEGKPRPAVIIQSDVVPTPEQILICPFTTTLIDAPLYRLSVLPEPGTGLKKASQLMVDQAGTARRTKLNGVIGRLSDDDLDQLSDALRFVLHLNP